MKIQLPSPLTAPPQEQSFIQDFKLLLRNQIRVTWNKLRHRPIGTFIATGIVLLGILSLIVSLGFLAFGSLKTIPPQTVQGFLSLLFMAGLVIEIFFGITAAFTTLYMSEDLELLFMAPIPLKVVFAVKSLSVLGSNGLTALLFVFLPGVFYGLLFEAGPSFYILVFFVFLGLLLMGTALAELINLGVMRIVPPHRSKEAMGFIGALAGILMALVFQIPSLLMSGQQRFDLGTWLASQEEMLYVMNFFPWGWSSQALVKGISRDILAGFGWSLLILFVGLLLFTLAFSLVERGFRQGFISLGQADGGKRWRKRPTRKEKLFQSNKNTPIQFTEKITNKASLWSGIWAITKKDLLSIKRDTREWFAYLTPLILLTFFVLQFLIADTDSSLTSFVTVFIMYIIMFSGNMALQSFGREGESDWILNSVPLAGWPIVLGKLLAAILPTLILMEIMLVGTALAIELSTTVILALMFGAVLLTLGSSAIGLYYSINNCRYNPDTPQQRISPGASLFMLLINLFFILLLSVGMIYLFRPEELISILNILPPVTFEGGVWSGILYGLYLLTRPLFWTPALRILIGILVTTGVWSMMFFGFMTATVRQSRKGFRVEILSGRKKKLFN